MKLKHFAIVLVTALCSCTGVKRIFDKPIVFDEERKLLTRQYIQEHYALDTDAITIIPKMIVLHWTVIPTLENSFNAFNEARLPSWRPDIKSASALNVSAHFLIDRDGTIHSLMPETTMGRHVIGLNYSAVGIENVGGTDEHPLTEAQLKSNIWLVKYLSKKYDIEYLIGHYEYPNFEGHPLWLEQDDGYRTEKEDPGPDFMKKVRDATKKFNFKPIPTKPQSDEN